MTSPRIYPAFILTLMLLATLMLSSCQSRRLVADSLVIDKSTNVSIAVVPYDVSFIGPGREHMTEDFLTVQAETKAQAFQQDLVSKIAKRVARRNFKNVSIQSPQETNSRLRDQGLSLVDLQYESPRKIIEALGVDAIVVGNVQLYSSYRNVRAIVHRRRVETEAAFIPNAFEVAVQMSVINKGGELVFNDADKGLRRSYFATFDSVNDRVSLANNRMSRRLPYLR